jgi:hypothetical protein
MSTDPPAPVVCFLHESATDANDTDFAVLGGLVINRKDLPEFDAAWAAMLAQHQLPSLHMIDLGPSGPYPHVVGDACRAMLADAVKAINKCRIFSFGASWDNRAHEVLFSANLRKRLFSVYSMIFMMAVEINRGSAAGQHYEGVIDYVLDDGNRFKRHVGQMHKSIRALPALADRRVGSLKFDSDSRVFALQAADVIAWATRREFSGEGLSGVHEPLKTLFDQFYVHSPAPPNLIETMSERFAVAEANVDPDTILGWLLLNRQPIFWSLLATGVLIAAASLWFGRVCLWTGLGVLTAAATWNVVVGRKMKRL